TPATTPPPSQQSRRERAPAAARARAAARRPPHPPTRRGPATAAPAPPRRAPTRAPPRHTARLGNDHGKRGLTWLIAQPDDVIAVNDGDHGVADAEAGRLRQHLGEEPATPAADHRIAFDVLALALVLGLRHAHVAQEHP